MVVSPDVPDLPYTMYNGMKCFELVAEPVRREILPGLFINAWGYNGSMPGPTIQAYPGDYALIRVVNRLAEPTSVHWHGLDIPNAMDGVPDVEPSPLIGPGEYFDYRFWIVNPPGTHMYHTHVNSATQEMMGLGGAFIILDPGGERQSGQSQGGRRQGAQQQGLQRQGGQRQGAQQQPFRQQPFRQQCSQQQRFQRQGAQQQGLQRDYFLMLQEFHVNGLKMGEVKPGTYDIDPMNHDFNFFTMNGRCFPFTTQLAVRAGENVRIRLGNIVHDAHPIHIHGHQFAILASDGNEIPAGNRLLKSTVNVASGETYDIGFIADNPGIWPFHCHIPHHMTNNMQKTMGGMFTVIKYI